MDSVSNVRVAKMSGNHLEDLVAEWYEFNGYFVRRNIQVGKRSQGGYDCELDVVAFHPVLRKLVHIEPSLDADSWEIRERRYRRKFELGRNHIPTLFAGIELPDSIEQIAIFVFGGTSLRTTIADGTILRFSDFMQNIFAFVRNRPLNNAMIPEQYPLLRTLQFAARSWPLVISSPIPKP
jgi:hypothetical protein